MGGSGILIGKLSENTLPARISAAALSTHSGVSRLIVPNSSLSPNTPQSAPLGAPSRTGNWAYLGGLGARADALDGVRRLTARVFIFATFGLGLASTLERVFTPVFAAFLRALAIDSLRRRTTRPSSLLSSTKSEGATFFDRCFLAHQFPDFLVDDPLLAPSAPHIPVSGHRGRQHRGDGKGIPDAADVQAGARGEDVSQWKPQHPQRDHRQHHRRHRIARAAQRSGQHLLQADKAEGQRDRADKDGAFADHLAAFGDKEERDRRRSIERQQAGNAEDDEG